MFSLFYFPCIRLVVLQDLFCIRLVIGMLVYLPFSVCYAYTEYGSTIYNVYSLSKYVQEL